MVESVRGIETTAPGIGRGLTLTMAVAAGLAVANIYYNQPMIGTMARSFPSTQAVVYIPTSTQLGYALGLLLLVPLGDRQDRRRLIVTQFLILALALVLAATSPTASVLIAASALLGASATVAQQIVPFAASLAAPAQRGRAIGFVMGGLLCGILLSRILAGLVAATSGWRTMFWLAVPLALFGAGTMWIALPRNAPHTDDSYWAAMKSLAHLWRDESTLRRATLHQAALFGSFSAFWTVLALHLQESTFSLGPEAAGLFGILGLVGVAAAPVAGRLADRRGPHSVIGIGAVMTLLSWGSFGLLNTIAGLVIGVITLDFGVQASLVSHQHLIYALKPEARGRLNTIFMTGMFAGGAVGSAGAITVWTHVGWPGVCIFGAALALVAIPMRTGGAMR